MLRVMRMLRILLVLVLLVLLRVRVMQRKLLRVRLALVRLIDQTDSDG